MITVLSLWIVFRKTLLRKVVFASYRAYPLGYRLCKIFVFLLEQFDKCAADDSAICVLCALFETLLISDTKTDHTWERQVHFLDTFEIGDFLLIDSEFLTGDSGC